MRLVLPKGSLESATLDLFEAADLRVRRSSSVTYRAEIDDPRIAEVRILRPQEIPRYVAEGLFDFGITGRDWVEETASEVVSLGELHYSKVSTDPVRIVLAVPDSSDVRSVEDLPSGVRVSSEYPELTRRFFAARGIEADVRLSYGATEAKVPDIVDAIVDTLLTSWTELIANPTSAADPAKRHAMGQILTLLQGVLDARTKVLVKLNVPADRLDAVVALLPSMKSPTVNQLHGGTGFAVESVVAKSTINVLIPALSDAGASDIIELSIAKIVP